MARRRRGAGPSPGKRRPENRPERRPESRPEPATSTSATQRWALPSLIVAVGAAVYANSFQGVFFLDDTSGIVDNLKIRHLWPPWAVVRGSTRPVVELSLALNYAGGGLQVWGYHAFNLVVHLLAALTLYGLAARTLRSPRLHARYGRAARWIALAAALLWVVHPLQTEGVDYIIQRGESLMGLFYLLTLYCGMRGATAPRPRGWYAAAVLACALGMGSKQVMVSAPLLMLLADRIFLVESYREALRRRWGLYAGLAATWTVLAVTLATHEEATETVLISGLTPWRYALTQPGVILHYLRLVAWPHPLLLDYTWPLATGARAILPGAIVILVLLAATALALWRQAWPGFWGAWFFLILAPSSSLLPLPDVAFEHRMYLPLAAVAVLVTVGAWEALRALVHDGALRRAIAVGLVVLAVAALGARTLRRNEAYRDEIAMWGDIAARRPDNPRAHLSLAVFLERRGKVAEAMPHYLEALRLKPDWALAHNNLGVALGHLGRAREAIAHLTEAVRLDPGYADAYRNLGVILLGQGQADRAIAAWSMFARLKPHDAEGHNNLGAALVMGGRMREAIAQLEEAARIDPGNARTQLNLGRALLSERRAPEAIPHLETALRLDPNLQDALRDLESARASQAPRRQP